MHFHKACVPYLFDPHKYYSITLTLTFNDNLKVKTDLQINFSLS